MPQFGGDFDLFFSSVFGKLPESIDTIFWERVANHLEAKKIDCSTANYIELLEPSKLFLRRMTGQYLTPRGHIEQCVYFLDATAPIDIIDSGLTQIEQKRDIFCLKSSYFSVFNPLNPLYQGTFEPIA